MAALNIADIRTEYMRQALDEEIAGHDPILFFSKWFAEAEAAQITEINAMTLATVDEHATPHARIVLLKGVENESFVFFTNYESDKGRQLEANPRAALLFFWKELERQVRIEGRVEKTDAAESDIYFHSRPQVSKLGAWASPQSRKIPHRGVLELNYEKYKQEFSSIDTPRPPHWGGYRVIATSVEFWQGRPGRLHDRIRFVKNDAGTWDRHRLAP